MKFIPVFGLCVALLAGGAMAQSIDQSDPNVTRLVIEKPVAPSTLVPKINPRADSPQDQAIKKDADDRIAARAQEISDACDADIKARIDWTKISAQDIDQSSPANSCGAAFDALEEMCDDSGSRERVGQGIKEVICTAGPHPAVALRARTLVYTLDWQSRNPAAFVYAWLAKNL